MSSNLLQLIARSVNPGAGKLLSDTELEYLLGLTNETERNELYKAAYQVKLREIGSRVYFRGLIEVGNRCAKDCYYCGIRAGNRKVERFQLSLEDIKVATEEALELNYGSVVLQSGEREDEAYVAFIEEALTLIRELSGGALGVTLSLGEQTEEVYRRWREAGAHRYLLRIETTNPVLYHKWHPVGCDFERRIGCLELLRKLDYQVGTGVLIGAPGQTLKDLVGDLRFFERQDIDMIGMGPYLVHRDTPMGQEVLEANDGREPDNFDLALNMIAVARLLLEDVNIASTTALHALRSDGRERGVLAGANVMMPNMSPLNHRKDYHLYQNKPTAVDSTLAHTSLVESLRQIGAEVGFGVRGDSCHYAKRRKNNS